MASNDRTEKPTTKRLKEAREKGQIASSRDVVQVAAFAASLVVIGRWGGRLMSMLQDELHYALSHFGDAPQRLLIPEDIGAMVVRAGAILGAAVGPIAATAAIATIAANLVQTKGLIITTEPLAVNFAKLSPAAGFKKFGSLGGYELAKMVVLTTALSWLGYRAVTSIVTDVPRLARSGTGLVVTSGWEATVHVLRQSLMVLAAVAAVDYAFRRHRFMKSQMMTKQEVKDEMKQAEGSPEVKGRIKKIQHEMFRKRMLTATKRATVVVTNPTHYAVALEYRRGEMAAPRVLAKGRGFLALRIREIARESGVPIVEQVSLARALYKTAEVGETIPGELFEAVAEVLAYLIRLKQLVLS